LIPEFAIRHYAGQSQVDIAIARQEIVLTILLERIFANEQLRDAVALKGGTALRKLVFGAAGRFSEDMDFVILADDYDSIQTELMAILRDDEAAEKDGVEVLEFDFEQSSHGTIQAVCEYRSVRGNGSFELDITGGDERRPLLPTLLETPLEQPYFSQLGFSLSPIRRMATAEMVAEKRVSIHRRYENRNPKDVWDLWKWPQLRSTGMEYELMQRLWPVRLRLDRQRWRDPGWFEQLTSLRFDWIRLRTMLPHGGRADGAAIIRHLQSRVRPWIDNDDHHLMAEAGTGRRRSAAEQQLAAARAKAVNLDGGLDVEV
jgi:predicted nucleotidyltransferase component of viral defense system